MSSFKDIPSRIFLDTSILQILQNYGAFVFENVPISGNDTIHRDPQGYQKLESLYNLFLTEKRAPFQFAISDFSFVEVNRKGCSSYLQWAYEILDHWNACLHDSEPPNENTKAADAINRKSFGYLGDGDRRLIQDALRLDCDAFLTMENRLPKNASHIERSLGIRVMTPVDLWECIKPWAGLFV